MFPALPLPLRGLAILVLVLALGACSQSVVEQKVVEPTIARTQTYSYSRDVKPILDAKCIACHACMDAPCQLKLSSGAGLLRGATPQPVYNGSRVLNADPTRLFVDAHGQAQWRKKGFYSVLNDQGGSLDDNLVNSLLYNMIELGRMQPLASNAPVPDDIKLGLQRENECPAPGEFAKYARKKPRQGMPLAMSGLSKTEFETLQQWIFEGAVIDEQPWKASPREQAEIATWEAFFNEPSPKRKLVARYLYEHLYPAHLYFSELDTGTFFELVRSATPPGEPIEIIATVRPNDDPGSDLYYRLRPVVSTLVHKTHMPYSLDATRMARFQELFLAGDWTVGKLPDYSRASAVNPVATFNDIPAGARYRFLLDNARYFVTTFIRGPVCAGQIATNVIEDQFWVMFQDPESDLSVTDPDYLASILPHLVLVPRKEGLITMYADWKSRVHEMNRYLELRGEAYRQAEPRGRSLKDIWDGSGKNENAALTVFRNFDNAMVTSGFSGGLPKTMWVMDYPQLERTYYLLVVNFNVFGSVSTQAETRLYFDLMRANGENNFLHFMPPQVRTSMRDSWYRGSDAQTKISKLYEIVNEDMPVDIPYKGDDPKEEFVSLVTARLQAAAGPPDVLNRCPDAPCYSADASPTLRRIERSLQTLSPRPAAEPGMRFVDFMPDVAFLRVVPEDPKQEAQAYTLIRNKAHSNVAFMFDEEQRRERDDDTLTVYRGLLGSYPNFFFNVPLAQLEDFTEALHSATTEQQYRDIVARYGLPRMHPAIWDNFQWFVDYMQQTQPLAAGVYDLSRYKKVSDLMSNETP
jgi:hypothetical protein